MCNLLILKPFLVEADKRSLRKDDVLSVRGSILDRNGQLLSVSVPMEVQLWLNHV